MMELSLPKLLKLMNTHYMMKHYAYIKSLGKVLKQLKFYLKNKIILKEHKNSLKKQTSQKFGVS